MVLNSIQIGAKKDLYHKRKRYVGRALFIKSKNTKQIKLTHLESNDFKGMKVFFETKFVNVCLRCVFTQFQMLGEVK